MNFSVFFNIQKCIYKVILTGLIFGSVVSFVSCNDTDDESYEPQLSPIPFIELDLVEFKQGENDQDLVLITVNYQDGDADLGLDRNMQKNDTVFQQVYYITTDDDTISVLNEKAIRFGAPNQPEFNKWDWRLIYDEQQLQLDTIRVVYNENYLNGFVDMYVKKPGKEFEIVDLGAVNYPYGPFNAVFLPITDEPLTNPAYRFNFIPETRYRGKLIYRLAAPFNLHFEKGKDIFKFKCFIKDRALNKSNVVETPEILFE